VNRPCFLRRLTALLLVLPLVSPAAADPPAACDAAPYVFGWPFKNPCQLAVRGGTSKGAAVTLDPGPTAEWQALQAPGLSGFERDRRAILAMAGEYRVSFDFLETVGYGVDYEPARPYRSWGTELVLVNEDRGDFISLQHVMVMYFTDGDGKVHGPHVMKHWRQDWQFEGRELLVYEGEERFALRRLSRAEAREAWVQTVYQVDDSPRYGGVGRWYHAPGYSSWISGETWRPLPRREHSVRDDYDVLIGTNRHSILPGGWVQEEENLKTRLAAPGVPARTAPYLAKEIGINRYERVRDVDFSAGREYWKATRAFWTDVAAFWREQLGTDGGLTIRTEYDGTPMFQPMLEYAQALADDKVYDAAEGRRFIEATLVPYLAAP